MKILYDHQIHTLQKYGGISRYFCELMSRFSKDPAMDFSLALRFSFNEHLLGLPDLDSRWSRRSSLCSYPRFCSAVYTAAQNERFRQVLAHILYSVNRRESERLLKIQDFDLVHPTYYDPFFLKFLRKKPCVITVHDMIHEIYPKNFPARDPISAWKKQVVERADAIITVSESTKTDIVKFLHIDPGRIHVIYHGNSFEKAGPGQQNPDLPDQPGRGKPYILFVGNRSGYKNFELFIRAVSTVLSKWSDLEVCCAGGGPFTAREKELLTDLQIRNRVQYFRPDDRVIKNLYSHARAFVFPSLYEGFGLPVLEAFSSGCPVILSNTSSLPEIGGDAALRFDPSDPVSLTGALERVLADDTLRTELIRRGHAREKLFSWEKTAAETKKVYASLVDR